MESVLIIGAGRFGRYIASQMSEFKCEVMIVDRDEKRLHKILDDVTNVLVGDSTDPEFMETLGVSNYDICIVAIGKDFQSSLETTLLLKELNAVMVISRAESDSQEKFLLKNGADEVVFPKRQTAIRTAVKLVSDSILDYILLGGEYSVFEMQVPKGWAEKTVTRLDIRRKYHLNIIAYRRENRVNVIAPDEEFEFGDTVFVIGEMKIIQKCFGI